VKIKPWSRHLENGHFWPKNTKLALVSSQGLKRRWESIFCNNSVQIWLVSMKNSLLAHGDWSSLTSEPSKSMSSSIHFALTNSPQTSSHWFALFLSFLTFLAGQSSKLTKKTRNLSSKHVSGGERARRAGNFFEKL
jgi:hypothetical protein